MPTDVPDSQKGILMVYLSDGELQHIEIPAIDESIVESDGTLDLNSSELTLFVQTLASNAVFDGRTIDLTAGTNGMASGMAV